MRLFRCFTGGVVGEFVRQMDGRYPGFATALKWGMVDAMFSVLDEENSMHAALPYTHGFGLLPYLNH
jgi:hypothetical protein